MPFYHKLGQIPHKRHTQFRKPDGGLYREELMGLEGFSSLQSTLYHNFIPPRVKQVEDLGSRLPETVDFGPIRHRAFRTADAEAYAMPASTRRHAAQRHRPSADAAEPAVPGSPLSRK